LSVFEQLHAFESGGSSNQFMRELGVILVVVVVVHLLVGISSLVFDVR